jgi:hypothetical protein
MRDFIHDPKTAAQILSADLGRSWIRVRPDDFVDDRRGLASSGLCTKGGQHFANSILLILVVFAHDVSNSGTHCFANLLNKVPGIPIARFLDLILEAFGDPVIGTAGEVQFLLWNLVLRDELCHCLDVY